MGNIRNVSKSGKARNRRIIKLAPMTRAVRSALAVSALTLGIGLAGNASAANHRLPAAMVHALQTERSAIDFAPVFDLTEVQDIAPLAFAPPVMPTLIGVSSHLPGDVVINNYFGGTVHSPGGGEEAIGISGYSDGGNVTITNHGDKYAETAGYGNAIGIYGYALTGDTTIDNSANLGATSAYGLADGIFASGANVGVTNSGNITADGYNWAVGIEAQGSNATSVSNSGDISVSASSFLQIEDEDGVVASTGGYQAFGIYVTASSGGAVVGNTGSVQVEGGSATGLYVQSEGDATVGNGGNIYAGSGLHGYSGPTYDYFYGTEHAVGIHALSSGVDAAVEIGNEGIIVANGIQGSVGITGAASAEGGTISVTNDGAVLGISYFGSAEGITVSGYAGASAVNNGVVGAYVYYGTASGVTALSFAGDTSVTNTGDVYVDAVYGANYGALNAYGLVSDASFGNASVDNSGYVYVHGLLHGYGIDASAGGEGNVSVTNSGDIVAVTGPYNNTRGIGISAKAGAGAIDVESSGSVLAYGAVWASGIYAFANTGDIDLENSGSITALSHLGANGIFSVSYEGDTHIANAEGGAIEFALFNASGYGSGIFAYADQGDISIDNAGSIIGHAGQRASGVRVINLHGDVSIGNSGTISVESDDYIAYGVYAATGTGDITVTNTGGSIEAASGMVAFGIYARALGGNATVDNGSEIQAQGEGAAGIMIIAAGDVDIANGAGIVAQGAIGSAIGIYGYSLGGDTTINNSGTVEASAVGNAIGIYGYALVGDTTIDNVADLQATSEHGLADGIFASGVDVGVTNSGNITADGYNWAVGIEAQGSNATSVSNSGDISVSALPFLQVEDDDGIVAATDGYQAFGIYVTAGGGGVVMGNTGNVQVEGGSATGLYVQSEGDATVGNGGNIYAGSGLHGYSGQTYDYYYGTGYAVGVNASSGGVDATIEIDNEGIIIANGVKGGIGITGAASAEGGTISVVNDGTVVGASYFGSAEGITVSGYAGASIENNGNVGAFVQYNGDATGLTALSFAGDTSVTNTGDVSVNAYYTAYGVVSFAGLGFASAINDGGQIEADSANTGIGMDVSGYTGASVTNSGDILVDAWKAYGIRANAGGGDVDVTNTGSIYATYGGPFNSRAFGIYGKSVHGDVGIVNDGGDIATHMNDLSVGIFGLSDNADVNVANGGSIYAYSANALAVGVYVGGDMGTASVNNTGSIEAYSYNDEAFGVLARGDAVKVGNSGDVSANGLYEAVGIAASSNNGDALVASSGGSIEVNAIGTGTGIDAQSMNGNAKVSNAGDISAMGMVIEASGIRAISGAGSAIVDNGGSIHAGSVDGDATGIYGYSIAGDVGIGNSGEVSAQGYYLATGIIARSYDGTLVSTAASSQISAASGFIAIGIEGRAEAGDVTVGNAGSIATEGVSGSVGIQAYSATGDVTVSSTGHIDAASEYGIAIGATGLTMAGDVEMSNGGLIEATGSIGSYGILAQSYSGNAVFNNAGAGHVEASGGLTAIGVLANSTDGDAIVNNAGVIHASDAYYAAAVAFEGLLGGHTLNNLATGVISADGDEGYAFAVAGTDAVETINNGGRLLGAIALHGDGDVFNNKAGGTWDVGSTLSTDFGDGNDTLANAAGGTITLDEGLIAFGAGDDTVNNAGRINLTNSTITMGDSQPAPLLVQAFLPQAVEINAFNNSGTLKVVGDSAVDTAGGIFTNTGVIDFGNGVTTDALTLDGTLAGTGNIAVDVDFDDHSADQLLIDGNVASNAVQTVNVRFTGVPTLSAMETKVGVVNVTGTSAASNFVAGQVVGYNWNGNFLSLGAGIVSTLDATNATDDVFSVGLTVDGLSDGGALAATAASGAAGFLNSQVGTFRQRLGVNPYGDAGKVLSAFVRLYSDQGDVDPTHDAGNFGQGGNFAYEQTSWGREFGINANLFGNFHAGVVLGNADSRQRLTGGVGENRMNGTSFGAYATWYVPEGLYVDLSGRWMGADIRSNSTGANLQSRTRTSAVSLEAGYEWKLGGVNVVPQAQYIRTRVEDVRTFHGENLDFTVQGGTFERGRVGVEVNKTFQSGDIRWTPYGSVSAIRDSGGKTAYTVGDFYGATGVSGSRTMAELGLGVQKGGLGLTLGVNWLDGGALKSFVGGQANVRYSW